MAERTEKVYDFATQQPTPNMLVRLKSSLTVGSVAGPFAVMYCLMEAIILMIVEFFFPIGDIDILPNFEPTTEIQMDNGMSKQYCEDPLAFGDHLFRVNSLQTHSMDSTAFENYSGSPIIIDKKKKNTNLSQNKIEPIIR